MRKPLASPVDYAASKRAFTHLQRECHFRTTQIALFFSFIACAWTFLAVPHASADALVFYACASGKQTLDQGDGGGNPFASSLIDILARPRVRLAELPVALQQLTWKKSGGFQSADVPKDMFSPDWLLVPPSMLEKRIALVLVVSDYGQSGSQPLPGAKHDADRIATALTKAGFVTEIALDLDLLMTRQKLTTFTTKAADYDAAIIYTTGHGVETSGSVYLLPADYPVKQQNAALVQRAIRLSEIAGAVRAKRINLVFYGGCRDDPFGQ
jgi:hypothetical protein